MTMATMEEIAKGLPSALKHASMKELKPGSYGQLRRVAHIQGKSAAQAESVSRAHKAAPFNQGWTTSRWEAGQARNVGRATKRQAKKKLVMI